MALRVKASILQAAAARHLLRAAQLAGLSLARRQRARPPDGAARLRVGEGRPVVAGLLSGLGPLHERRGTRCLQQFQGRK